MNTQYIYHTFLDENGKPKIAREKTPEEIKQELIDDAYSRMREEKINRDFRSKKND